MPLKGNIGQTPANMLFKHR